MHNWSRLTMEVIDAVKKLEEKHGKVKHIVVGSVAIEHKIYSGPFAQYFPDAGRVVAERRLDVSGEREAGRFRSHLSEQTEIFTLELKRTKRRDERFRPLERRNRTRNLESRRLVVAKL